MPKYTFHLYVLGQTSRSLRAAANLRHICKGYLGADYELVVIDVKDRPDLAEAANIFITPATIRIQPLPVLKVIGDLSDPEKVAAALGIQPAKGYAPFKENSP